MTEVIVRHLVATSPGGDVAPCSGVNNKGRGTDGEHLLLTYNGNDERQVARRLVAALLSATWHCVVRAHLLGLMTWTRRACRVGTCRARCGYLVDGCSAWWFVERCRGKVDYICVTCDVGYIRICT